MDAQIYLAVYLHVGDSLSGGGIKLVSIIGGYDADLLLRVFRPTLPQQLELAHLRGMIQSCPIP